MNIFVTGATGFIASQIVVDLMAAGHMVTCGVRDVAYAKNVFPDAQVVRCDFVHDVTRADWLMRLKNIDVVINCVGILHHPNKKNIWAIHYHAPHALFDACIAQGVQKIIQISALGVDQVDVDYAKSKLAADEYLLSLPIPSVVLRPSLVYGRGSYGGTSLFRGLAGLPGILPVPGKGRQQFQPIHIQDLSRAVVNLVAGSPAQPIQLCAVGPQKITLLDLLRKLRSWLGFSRALTVFIPLCLIRVGAWFGDCLPGSAMNDTSYRMLSQDNIASDAATRAFQQHIGFTPRDVDTGLRGQPSTVQDHWHARLFFLKPLLSLGLAFVWIFTALCSALFYSHGASYQLLAQAGVPAVLQPWCLYGASALDALIGVLVLCGYRVARMCVLQLGVILFYTIWLSCKIPSLWLDPLAPLVKNIPMLLLIAVTWALASDR